MKIAILFRMDISEMQDQNNFIIFDSEGIE